MEHVAGRGPAEVAAYHLARVHRHLAVSRGAGREEVQTVHPHLLRQYQSARPCRDCGGTKLQPEALQVRVDGRTIAEVAQWPVRDLRTWIDALTLSGSDAVIADAVLREARARTRFLTDVGLTYLTLDRATRTLSGGEAQRITLSNALGAALVDATYVLDEPSIGLHSRDLDRLLSLLTRLRDLGNTVVMVEHDLEAMRIADYMVEMGPAAGEHGGQVVFAGPMADVEQSPLTGSTSPARVASKCPPSDALWVHAGSNSRARAHTMCMVWICAFRWGHDRGDRRVGVWQKHHGARRAVPRARIATAW